jgi:two-component system, sensor histidine kinase YesM
MNKATRIKSVERKFFFHNFRIFLLLALVPVVILGSLSVAIIHTYIKDEVDRNSYNLMAKLENIFTNINYAITPMQIALSFDGQTAYICKTVLEENQLSYPDLIMFRNISSQLAMVRNLNDYISSVYVYYGNSSNSYLSDTGKAFFSPAYIPQWYKMFHLMTEKSLEQLSYRSEDTAIVILRSIKKNEGVFVVNLNSGMLMQKIIANTDIDTQPYGLSIFNSDRQLLYSWGSADFEQIKQNSSSFITYTRLIKPMEWNIELYIPKTLVFSAYYHVRFLFILLTFISLLISVVLALYFSNSDAAQIADIVKIMKAAENNRPIPRVVPRKGSPFGYIIHGIVRAFIQQKYLKTKYEVKEIRLKNMQLMALQTQLKPHFLFNTLEIINWKIFRIQNHPVEINSMIENLSELLRYSLSAPEEQVTFEEELKHLEYYVAIQQIRYNNNFDIKYDAGKNAMKVMVPRLILQPVVENSLQHGLRELDRRGLIIISGIIRRDMLYITITDNGRGMRADEISELQKTLHSSVKMENSSQHIGLHNVYARLFLQYHTRLSVESMSDKGTIVKMKIPVAAEKQGDNRQ